MSNQYKWFINHFSKKKYLFAHMITVLNSYPPKSVLLCMRHICGGSNVRGSPLRYSLEYNAKFLKKVEILVALFLSISLSP